MDTWVLRMCRRACLRQLVVWGSVAVAGVAVMLVNARYYSNFLRGPVGMTSEKLAAITDLRLSPDYFVRVSGTQTLTPGIQQISIKNRGRAAVRRIVSANYYALDLGDKLLIVKSSSEPSLEVEGELRPMPRNVDKQLSGGSEMREYRNRFPSVYLDATRPFRTAGYLTLGLCAVFFGLAAWKALPAWQRLQDPESHPLVARVASWGSLYQISAEIEMDLANPSAQRFGEWTLTPKYLVRSSFFGFDVLRFHDLMWAYKTVTTRRINFVPVAKLYHAVFLCHAGSATVQGSDKQVDEILRSAAQRAPWAIFGHNKDLQKAYRKERDRFRQVVEQRRGQVASA
jgi:hypothetical protein